MRLDHLVRASLYRWAAGMDVDQMDARHIWQAAIIRRERRRKVFYAVLLLLCVALSVAVLWSYLTLNA